MSATPDTPDTDVVIVGAGPIGLATACALAHHGVRFRIFERAHGIPGASKGHNVIARAQELLHAIGARDALAEKAYVAPFTQFLLDRDPIARLDSRGSGSPFDAVLFSNQGTIEEVLTGLLVDRRIRVETGREVDGIVADGDGVSLETFSVDADGNRTGDAEQHRCRYLVGADGSAGTVRKAMGIDLDLQDFSGRATRQMDATLRWRRPTTTDTAWFFLFPHGFAGILPVWEGQHRFFLLENTDAMPSRDPTREEMVERGREVTGDPTFDLVDPVWSSYGTFSHGVAPSYSQGRVFLAGDAGHKTLPIGGQGMNAGFLDAISIAWRLAMTLADAAGPAVLDSYDAERRRAHALLGDQQVRGFEQLMRRNRVADTVLDGIAKVLPAVGTHVFGGSDLAQLDVAYPDSPLSEDTFSRLNPKRLDAVRAGGRAPDAVVTTAEGTPITLFDLIYNPDGRTWGWRLFLFDGGDRRSYGDLADAAKDVAAIDWIRPMLVVADPRGDPAKDLPVVYDFDGMAYGAFGLASQPAIVLIRPDGHIAFRASSSEGDSFIAFVDQLRMSEPRS